jgi:phage shock protein A
MTDQQEPIDAEIVDDPPPPPPTTLGDYDEAGVPTFDYVRDQIENRYATSTGANELAGESPQGRTVDEELAAREQAGRDRLEEIRRAMKER